MAPQSLRHTHATEVRAKYDLEHCAESCWGTARPTSTQIYAERNLEKGQDCRS